MTTDMDVIIIGAGMSGIGMAIQLIRNFGTRSFEIIEKTSDIGGTWFLNSYPGCGCDVSFPYLLPNVVSSGLIAETKTGPVTLLFVLFCAESKLVAEICPSARDS